MLTKKNMTRDEVWAEMARIGYEKVIVYFSGGHDQGGVDRILASCTGDTEKELEVTYITHVFDPSLNDYVPERELTLEERLIETFTEPVYAKYYTFAGEFYVDGQVIWNLADRTVILRGDEEHPSYDGFEEAI